MVQKQHITTSGTPSYFGPVIATAGGYGGTYQDPGGQPFANGGPGASSGGSYGGSITPSTGDSFPGTDTSAATPGNGWGHLGGTGQ